MLSRPGFLLVSAIAIASAAVLSAQKKAPALTGGDGTLYVGTYAGSILTIDEASEKVTGQIKLTGGIPRSLSLSEDRTKFLVLDSTFQRLEIAMLLAGDALDLQVANALDRSEVDFLGELAETRRKMPRVDLGQASKMILHGLLADDRRTIQRIVIEESVEYLIF